MNSDSGSVYISGKSASQDSYKCKSCGFIAFGEEPERAKYKKCLGCGNIMGETAPEKKTTVYKSHTFKDDEREKTINDNTNSQLVTCGSCSHHFSKRAEKCPKCGWRPLAICQVCRKKIPDDSISCPECGDPRPFELQEKTKQEKASHTIMYDTATRYGAYKRGTCFFTIYSAILFFATPAVFLQLKTILYFFIGYAVSGAVAVSFMSWQYKIETRLNPKFWILNILIDVAGYFVFTSVLFYLFF